MDERIRNELAERLDAFDGALPELGRLTATVDGLWASDESIPASEREALRSEWETLEQILALTLDRGDNALSDSDRQAAVAAAHRAAEVLRAK